MRQRRPDEWVREGGHGLPPKGPSAKKGDGNVWLFTCTTCGKRWSNPPGPVMQCGCGGDTVCHRIQHEEYTAIRLQGDPREAANTQNSDGGKQ